MNDLREALDAAFDTTAADQTPEPSTPEAVPAAPPEPPEAGETPPSTPEPEGQEAQPGRPRGADGRFVKSDEPAPAAPKEPTEKADQPSTPPAPEKPAAQPSAQPVKAPQSWKPSAREEWSKISPLVQAEVARREREVQQALQETSEARQGYQKYRETVAPFEQMIRSEGGEPLAAVQSLLQTAYALRTAPATTKAQMIARMVQTFLPGRDGLELLDRSLAGEAPPPEAPRSQEFRDPRVDQILARFQHAERAEVQTRQEQARQEIETVQKLEFFQDLRQDMADIMEMSQRRGLQITVKDAYDKAAALHPEISKVLAQRAEAQRLANPSGSTQAARRAAVSVRSTPAIQPKTGDIASDLRSTLDAAFDAATGR